MTAKKMFEELAMESEMETRKTTALEKIYVTQPMEITQDFFDSMLKDLSQINNGTVRETLLKYVPNYQPASN